MTKPLTSQQEHFARLVAEGKSQSDACTLAGMTLHDKPPAGQYYVYVLVDPRDGAIFYVGKGLGDRMFNHNRCAQASRERGHPKSERILEIRAAGLAVKPLVFAVCDSEGEALGIERRLISAWKSRLTNILLGSSERRPRDEVGEFLKRITQVIGSIRPFDDWVSNAREDQLALAEKHFGGPVGFYNQMLDGIEDVIHLQADNFKSRGLMC